MNDVVQDVSIRRVKNGYLLSALEKLPFTQAKSMKSLSMLRAVVERSFNPGCLNLYKTSLMKKIRSLTRNI